ncbi:hypothetical protein ACFL26_00905 [Patescibacteria group bacterium]
MTFEELRAEIGVELAVIAWHRKGRLDENEGAALGAMTFDECVSTYNEGSADGELRNALHNAMTSKAETFTQWDICWQGSAVGSEQHRLCLEKMADTAGVEDRATSFAHWKLTWERIQGEERELRRRVKAGLGQTANSFGEWRDVLNIAQGDIVLQGQAMAGMNGSAETFRQLRHLSRLLSPDSTMWPDVIDRMCELAESFDQIRTMLALIRPDDERHDALLDKLAECRASPRDWVEVFQNAPPGSELARIAQRNMAKTARRTVPAVKWNED